MHLSRDELRARFEYDEVCHHLDGFVCARCSGGIKWFPRITVEKYSVDQTAYAERKFAELQAERRRPWVARFGLDRLKRGTEAVLDRIEGDWLRDLFPGGPEEGYAYDAGNSLVNGGLNNVTYLLTTGRLASSPSATAAQNPLGPNGATATSVIGVGTSTTAWAATQTALGTDNTVNAWYQAEDASFPTTSTNGTINGQVTVASGNANFSWNEWCWATGSGTITAGSGPLTTAGSVFAGAASMFNRKVPASSLGSKASGASWVFTQTITFS